MSGRRLLDVAAVLKASRAVASKHLAYRGNQLDGYNKTSSLARAVENQTDRVALTIRAASALAVRLSGQGGEYSTHAGQSSTPAQDASIPSKASVEGSPVEVEDKQGLAQDHFYQKSEENTTANPVQDSQIKVKQEKANKRPLPDGSIPPAGASLSDNVGEVERNTDVGMDNGRPESAQRSVSRQDDEQVNAIGSSLGNPTETTQMDQASHSLAADQAKKLQREYEQQIPSKAAEPPPLHLSATATPARGTTGSLTTGSEQGQDLFYSRSPSSGKVLSALPRIKIPKAAEDSQQGDLHVADEQIDQDVYYSAKSQGENTALSNLQAVPEQDEPSEDMYSEIFQTSKGARLLKGQPRPGQRSKGLDLRSTESMLKEAKKSSHEQDNFSFSSRNTPQKNLDSLEEQGNTGGVRPDQHSGEEDVRELAEEMAKDAGNATEISEDLNAKSTSASYEMRESRVPSSRFGRLWQYGGLATSMAFGAVGETVRRATGTSNGGGGSLMLSASNMERLVAKLSRMRGAALKLGQMMSFQDSKMLPGPINEVLQRVQDSADYMPASQRNKVLSSNLGSDWRDLFSTFGEKPIAAASIGQVHSAVLKSNGVSVAIKVQYPGVANSIDSDLNNLSILLTASRLLPKGLYLDKTIANARTELAWECDYLREAEAGRRFQQLLHDEKDTFVVPSIFSEASGPQVITMEMMNGIGVTKVKNLNQDQKDWIGTQILRLCLREITEFKYMQTDPNWTNFLFNAKTNKLELLDFGASREYPDKFILPYIRVLLAASQSDRKAVRDLSIQLGYLTGHESSAMLNAHIKSVLTLAEPFSDKSPEVYDFRDQTITDRKFVQLGCPNCEKYLGMQNQTDVVTDCTSQVFEGLITLSDPKVSWVAKWQRLTEYQEGVYATKVVGLLPDEFVQNLEDNGIKYIPRDGSAEEDDT